MVRFPHDAALPGFWRRNPRRRSAPQVLRKFPLSGLKVLPAGGFCPGRVAVQPTQGHMPGGGVQGAVVGQHAGEHHGAGHRNGHAEQGPGLPVPAEQVSDRRAQADGYRNVDHGPGRATFCTASRSLR